MSDLDNKRAGLQRTMDRMGLNLHQVAKRADVPDSTLRSFLTGATRSLRGDTERKVAAALGLTVDGLYGEDYAPRPKPAQVWVKGYLGAGAGIEMFEAMGENEGFYQVARPPGVSADIKLGAMEIRGYSMPPFKTGDIVYYEERDTVDLDAILGEACVVEVIGDGMLFKEVRRGYEPGTFNLHSWDGSEAIENVRIRRAMPVVALVKRGRAAL